MRASTSKFSSIRLLHASKCQHDSSWQVCIHCHSSKPPPNTGRGACKELGQDGARGYSYEEIFVYHTILINHSSNFLRVLFLIIRAPKLEGSSAISMILWSRQKQITFMLWGVIYIMEQAEQQPGSTFCCSSRLFIDNSCHQPQNMSVQNIYDKKGATTCLYSNCYSKHCSINMKE